MPKKEKSDDALFGLALLGGGALALSRFLGGEGGNGGGGGNGDGQRTVDFTADTNGRRVVANAVTSGASVRRYEWGWGDGTGTTTKQGGETQAIHDYAQQGTYTITLTVIWQDGLGDSIQKEVTVTRQDPQASIVANTDGLEVTATASASSDPQGDIAEYSWNWGDGTTEVTTSATAQHVYTQEGTYEISVSVVDAQGNTDLAQTTISVANRTPSASINYSTDGLELTATASGSSDPDGNISHYEWDFGDGSGIQTTQDPTVQYVYATAGTYTVTVTVIDELGAGDAAQTTVSVALSGSAPSATVSLLTGHLDRATRIQTGVTDAEDSAEDIQAQIDWYVNGSHTHTTGPEDADNLFDFSMGWTVIGADVGDTIEVVYTVTDTDGRTATATDSKTAEEPVSGDPPQNLSLTLSGTGLYFHDAIHVEADASDPDTPFDELEARFRASVGGTETDDTGWVLLSNRTGWDWGWTSVGADEGDEVTVTMDVRDDTGNIKWVTDRVVAGNGDGGTGDDGGNGDTGQSFDNTLFITPIARDVPIDTIPFNMATSGEVTVSPGTTPDDYTNGEIGGQVSMSLDVGQTYEIKYNGSIDGVEWSETSLVAQDGDGTRLDPYELTDDAGPRKQWFGGDGSDVIEATFRVSRELYRKRGQIPARVAAEWIGGALEARNISYDLLYDFEPIHTPNEYAVCFSPWDTNGNLSGTVCRLDGCDSLDCCTRDMSMPSAHIWWNALFNDSQGAQNRIDAFNDYWGVNFTAIGENHTGRKDSNLLLTDREGGGCAFRNGNLGAVGANNIDEFREYSAATSPDTFESGVWAIMHEFGHNLGYSHPHDECGDLVGGLCENGSESQNLLDGFWYATPCNASQKAAPCTNRCGVLNPKRTDPVRMNRMYFAPCTAEIFREHTGSQQGQTAQAFEGDGVCHTCDEVNAMDGEALTLSLSLGSGANGHEDCDSCGEVGGTGHSHDTVHF